MHIINCGVHTKLSNRNEVLLTSFMQNFLKYLIAHRRKMEKTFYLIGYTKLFVQRGKYWKNEIQNY